MSHRGQTEGEYNYAALTRADWRSSAALLDGRFIRLPGQYPVEACDILSDRGEFIHVKRKARSSTLSHLWEQAFVSAQLLRRRAEARFQVCRHIEEALTMWVLPLVSNSGWPRSRVPITVAFACSR
jgi:uncharacterized protein (TIGR04141 family)